jgi:hypothetical protein
MSSFEEHLFTGQENSEVADSFGFTKHLSAP